MAIVGGACAAKQLGSSSRCGSELLAPRADYEVLGGVSRETF